MIIIKIILWVLLAVLLVVALALAIPVTFRIRYTHNVNIVIQYLFLKYTVVGEEEQKKQSKIKRKKNNEKSEAVNKKKNTAANKKTISEKKNTAENKKAVSEKKTVVDNKKTVSAKKIVAEKKTISSEKKINEEKISYTKSEGSKKFNKKSRKKKEKKEENAAVKWIRDTFKEKGLSGILNVFKEIAKLAGTFLKPIFKHIRIKQLDLNVTVAFEDAAETAINYGYFCSGIYPALAILLRIAKYDDYNVNIVPDFDKKECEFDVFANLSIVPWFAVFGAVHALVDFLILKYKGKL